MVAPESRLKRGMGRPRTDTSWIRSAADKLRAALARDKDEDASPRAPQSDRSFWAPPGSGESSAAERSFHLLGEIIANQSGPLTGTPLDSRGPQYDASMIGAVLVPRSQSELSVTDPPADLVEMGLARDEELTTTEPSPPTYAAYSDFEPEDADAVRESDHSESEDVDAEDAAGEDGGGSELSQVSAAYSGVASENGDDDGINASDELEHDLEELDDDGISEELASFSDDDDDQSEYEASEEQAIDPPILASHGIVDYASDTEDLKSGDLAGATLINPMEIDEAEMSTADYGQDEPSLAESLGEQELSEDVDSFIEEEILGEDRTQKSGHAPALEQVEELPDFAHSPVDYVDEQFEIGGQGTTYDSVVVAPAEHEIVDLADSSSDHAEQEHALAGGEVFDPVQIAQASMAHNEWMTLDDTTQEGPGGEYELWDQTQDAHIAAPAIADVTAGGLNVDSTLADVINQADLPNQNFESRDYPTIDPEVAVSHNTTQSVSADGKVSSADAESHLEEVFPSFEIDYAPLHNREVVNSRLPSDKTGVAAILQVEEHETVDPKNEKSAPAVLNSPESEGPSTAPENEYEGLWNLFDVGFSITTDTCRSEARSRQERDSTVLTTKPRALTADETESIVSQAQSLFSQSKLFGGRGPPVIPKLEPLAPPVVSKESLDLFAKSPLFGGAPVTVPSTFSTATPPVASVAPTTRPTAALAPVGSKIKIITGLDEPDSADSSSGTPAGPASSKMRPVLSNFKPLEPELPIRRKLSVPDNNNIRLEQEFPEREKLEDVLARDLNDTEMLDASSSPFLRKRTGSDINDSAVAPDAKRARSKYTRITRQKPEPSTSSKVLPPNLEAEPPQSTIDSLLATERPPPAGGLAELGAFDAAGPATSVKDNGVKEVNEQSKSSSAKKETDSSKSIVSTISGLRRFLPSISLRTTTPSQFTEPSLDPVPDASKAALRAKDGSHAPHISDSQENSSSLEDSRPRKRTTDEIDPADIDGDEVASPLKASGEKKAKKSSSAKKRKQVASNQVGEPAGQSEEQSTTHTPSSSSGAARESTTPKAVKKSPKKDKKSTKKSSKSRALEKLDVPEMFRDEVLEALDDPDGPMETRSGRQAGSADPESTKRVRRTRRRPT